MGYSAPDFEAPSDRDRVRIYLNDLEPAEGSDSFTDEAIAFMLSEEGTPELAAVRLAGMLQNKYAKKADVSLGPMSVSYARQSDDYGRLAADILSRAPRSRPPIPTAGGLATDTDPLSFGRGMHDDASSYPAIGD